MNKSRGRLDKSPLNVKRKGLAWTLCVVLLTCLSQAGCDGTESPPIDQTAAPSAINPKTDPPAAANAEIYTPKGPIEAKYIATGPWAISETRAAEPCDRKGNLCTIYHPTAMGSNPLKGMTSGFAHPVIAWANGTGVLTDAYSVMLRHWASWGFVVVASDDGSTGLGESTEDAVNYIVAQSQSQSSEFFHKIDGTQIGVSGHSQGGLTAIHLFARRPELFKTSVPWSATTFGAGLVFGAANVFDLNRVRSGSIFFWGSATDLLGNSALQLVDYQSTSDNVGKAIASLTNGGHDGLVRPPECNEPECIAARGYSTAWMMWRLQDAADVESAFVPGTGEFSRSHPLWSLQMSNGK